ncbi:hypothetical protein GCM10010916_28410 [Paenibacillus abyssi]|uniref:CS domain-containing protein n=2 Tax=Paenibacillus abyssi TaxID=1340531 RepID=A0A917D5M7_9BACL|nr:hypothetical protein GCM10010916_28410 [Paenibacillus abyssi]
MMDWDEFEKFMIKQLPFLSGQASTDDTHQNNNAIGNYVQKVMKRFLNNPAINHPYLKPFTINKIEYEMFETHRSIFVQCRVPKNASPYDMSFSVNKRKLKISHDGKTEEILLTSDVDSRRSTAKYKNGILEIRLPKRRQKEPFHEIAIHE